MVPKKVIGTNDSPSPQGRVGTEMVFDFGWVPSMSPFPQGRVGTREKGWDEDRIQRRRPLKVGSN